MTSSNAHGLPETPVGSKAGNKAAADAAFGRGDFATVRRLAHSHHAEDSPHFDKLLWSTGNDRLVLMMALAVASLFLFALFGWAVR